MEENGWPFDMDKATALQAKLAGKRELAGQRLRDIFGQLYVRNGGKEFVPKRDDKVRGYYKDAPSCKIKPVDFNPASRDHIADRLIKIYGWKPETFTDGGKPELDEDTINALPYSEAKDIAEYLLIDKRLGFLSEGKQALITHATNERPLGGKLTGLYHIHPRINSGGTVTHRASHSNPPIAGTPKVSTDKAGNHIHGVSRSVGSRVPRPAVLVPAVAGRRSAWICQASNSACSLTTWAGGTMVRT
jgi:DNA polymerase-1